MKSRVMAVVPLPGGSAGGKSEIPRALGFATGLSLLCWDLIFYGPNRCPIHHCITHRPNSPWRPSAVLPPGASAFSGWSCSGHFVPRNIMSAESFPELLQERSAVHQLSPGTVAGALDQVQYTAHHTQRPVTLGLFAAKWPWSCNSI